MVLLSQGRVSLLHREAGGRATYNSTAWSRGDVPMAENEPPVPVPFLPAHLGVELQVCSPPYERLQGISVGGNVRLEPPLGSVIYATGRSVLAVLEQLAVAIDRWPWIAPCACLPATEYAAEKYASLDRILRSRLAVVRMRSAEAPTAVDVTRAVAMRNQPTAGSLAGWLCVNTGAQSLAAPLVEQFAYALGERPSLPHSVSFYSRVFAPGGLRARDWRAVATLVRAHQLTVRGRFRRGTARDSIGLAPSPRTLDAYAIRYLGRTWRSASQQVGWEWLLELVIRRERLKNRG